MRKRQAGQSFIEFALSVIGLLVLVFITLQVWVWLSGMLGQRQQAFQDSRKRAGTRAEAGFRGDYERPLLQLVGEGGSVGGGGGSDIFDLPPLPPVPDIPAALCDAAVPLLEQAGQHCDNARAILDSVRPEMEEALALADEYQRNQDRLDEINEILAGTSACCSTSTY